MKLQNPETGEIWDSETGAITPAVSAVDAYMARNAQIEPEYSPTQGMSGMDKFMSGAGKAVTDTGRGIAQFFGADNQQAIDESRRLDAALMDTGAGLAGNVAGHVAQSFGPGFALRGAGMVPGLSRLGAAGKAMTTPQTAKQAGLLGGLYAGSQPVATGESRAMNSLLGAGGGAVGQKVGQFVSRGVGDVSAHMRGIADKARGLGAKVPAGSATGSVPLRQVEASFASNPLTAGPHAKMMQNNQGVINQTVLKAVGQNGDEVTEELLGKAAKDIGDKIKGSLKDQTIELGDDLLDSLASVESKYIKLPTIRGDAMFRNVRDYLLDKLSAGNMSGKEYQAIRSELGKVSNKAWNSVDNANPSLGQAIDEMVDALDDHAAAQLPKANLKLFSEGRRQWANFKALEHSKNGANVSGPKLANYLNRKQKTAFRRGGGSTDKATQDMYDIARFADNYRGIVGDSGTATRLSIPQMAGQSGGGATLGYLMGGSPEMAALGALTPPALQKIAQMGLYNQPVQKLLSSQGLLGMGVPQGVTRAVESSGSHLPIGLISSQ